MRREVRRFLASETLDEKLTKAPSGIGARVDVSWNASGADKSRD
jgi:hypothetical protein